ncbi:uncharacterized protein (DUF305 family) [Kitasatospora sp. GAS204A]|uniref:DUF305 domain-containing protein n=1 Tax=unclassified Kitasatospora TaxID=2633591 RepID=UPI00247438E3|nr:DUF305 domain-containing protein [Kitasatospora sp. GAS204B]MDH6116084.1 uncharacterized protein (DUF305 family) [Kitasatospora sp. GAS204B]
MTDSRTPEEDEGTGETDELAALGTSPTGKRRRTLWWPAALAAVVALCLGVPALVAGGSSASGSAVAAPASDSPEAGFARDMATHHQQAIDMSFIIRDRTSNAEVRGLAFDIINTQANQRGMLMGWLNQWGLSQSSAAAPMAWMKMAPYQAHDGSLMPGMATNAQLAQLQQLSGTPAEIFYLQLMVQHHTGGAAMAQGYVDLAKNAVEKALAQSMVTAQTSEIQLMTSMLAERGAKPLPTPGS